LRRLKLAWFVIGALTGCLATLAAFIFLPPIIYRYMQEQPAAPSTADGVKPGGKTPAAGAVADCPELAAAEAPWAPAVDGSGPAGPKKLEIPRGLRRRVDFWKDLWGKYPDNFYLFVDRRRPWIIHQKIDCRDLLQNGAATNSYHKKCDRRLIIAKRKLRKKLRRQRRRPRRALLARYDNKRRLARRAWRNLLVIEGHASSFDKALERLDEFGAHVERIFVSRGMPGVLSRVAIIESLANPQAVSPVGAVGAYQFVAGTARQYLTVAGEVDERLDPRRSGWAAANYLEELYREFKSWPLALTAYNTGPNRLKRVVRRRRTRDIAKIADRGSVGSFGFDGQNYYAQLLAVIELTTGERSPRPGGELGVFEVIEPAGIARLAECLGMSVAELAADNPALAQSIVSGEKPVPKGYLLAVIKDGQKQPAAAGIFPPREQREQPD